MRKREKSLAGWMGGWLCEQEGEGEGKGEKRWGDVMMLVKKLWEAEKKRGQRGARKKRRGGKLHQLGARSWKGGQLLVA